ncbi:MAG: diguanylate cyclase [Bacillota bacterium]
MIKTCMRFFNKLSSDLYINTDFKNKEEFERKYTAISLQRGKIFKWVTLFVSFYSLYLDLILNKDATIDLLYRRILMSAHIAALVLSLSYIVVYSLLIKSQRYRISKAVIISDMFLSLLTAAILSLNSQRFTGNIDAYIIVAFSVAMVIPMYPKWVIGTYGFVHVSFLVALSFFYHNNTVPIKLFNSTTMVVTALVLFVVLYKCNVNNFLNAEMLKEDKSNFIKLFEINPFPLMISKFDDGKIQYANRRAMLFYEIPEQQLAMVNHKDLYKNMSDVNIIHSMLETNGIVNGYVAEQKTLSGKIKRPIVNYELIDYFGEKSILIGVADIGEIKRMEHELTIHASMDILTGVLNRRVGMDLVRKRYEAIKRENGGFILCFIDIDNLKIVNDRFGHLEGDTLIIDVCRIIREEIRPNDLIFRYGGDEFMVLFNSDDEREIDRTCSKIAERFEALNKGNYKPYPINASMGIFSYKPEMDLDLEQIIETVDRNMYHNKLTKK